MEEALLAAVTYRNKILQERLEKVLNN